LYEAAHLARDLLPQHGLHDWRFAFDHARRRFGRCDYTNRRITLSRALTFLNSADEVRDTLLHEIAHALTPGAKHGPRWRAKCREIGARPMRCFTEERVVTPARRPPRYWLGCPACDWWVERRRRAPRRRKYVCVRCRGKVVYRERDEAPSVRGGG
jgi:predicted SprT family Zn-dependent metalloprotease